MIRLKLLLPVLLSLLLAACHDGAPGADAADDAGPAGTARVQVEVAAIRPMHRTLTAYGTVAFAPQSQQIVTTGAQVAIEEVMVVAGQDVHAGQPLLRVRATPDSVLEWERARADQDAAARELQRVERMFAQHLATNADMATARQGALNAQAAWKDAVARGAAPGAHLITAPRELAVTTVDVNRGDIAAAGAALVHLGNSADLEVRLGVEPADLAQIALGQPVTLHPSYAPDTGVAGNIMRILRQVDPQSRLSQALVRVPPTQDLLPGTTVRAEIDTTRPRAVLSLPRSAVLLDAGTPHVFLVRAAAAHKVNVAVDDDDGERVAVTSGVKAGDVVVVQGNYELQDGMKVVVETPGHR